MNRSSLILLWALPVCFLAPSLAEARVLQKASSDLCIGVDGASVASGARLKQFRCDGKPNQQWRTKKVEPNTLNFINGKSRKCMGVDHASTAPGAAIRQFDCDGSENQKWMFTTCGASGKCLVNKKSKLCVAAEHMGHDAPLEQARCDVGSKQVWTGLN